MNNIDPGKLFIGVAVVFSIVFLGILVVLTGDDPTSTEDEFLEMAKEVGIEDTDKFLEDYRSDEVKEKVESERQDALDRLGGSASTPSVFINGENVQPAQEYDVFEATVQAYIDNASEDELPLQIEIFEDFYCSYCAGFFPISYQIQANFSEQVEVEHKHLPFLRDASELYARAVEAAVMQDKGYEFSRAVFEKLHDRTYTELDSLEIKE